ncbi:SusC/RagA family TonB-linked outer membrane protein [Sphingobacterium detergens]|uniref:TonB-linked SusC/RagA family outer membrane protein n=1 Tax=Sphingobacterium detergens TaxID=1145106 RepID=A0A420BGW1_SPHD1|nr:TonB-dependent receptor [Sphingobacterium detergens]RKE55940.1 TonB-linked SusC/RagA family outer membrane protein [Sphingobacterium detergens]
MKSKNGSQKFFWPKLRHRVYLMLVASFLFIINVLHAQDSKINVSGLITDKATGLPLTNVSVKLKGTNAVTSSNENGRYAILASKGGILIFNHLGFHTQEVRIAGNQQNIQLTENIHAMDEVVVVGYGKMKRGDLTGAVVSVTADDISKSVSTSLDQALQGRAAGVSVTQNSGAPGGGISVSIRGTNSFSGNEPLYVIDGIPIDGNTRDNSSALSSINPSDIVSMEILKDASAAAIYGTRAANGVVLISTKRGQAGKTKLGYEGYVGFQQLPTILDVLNLREYAVYQNLRSKVIGFGDREEFKDPSLLGEGTNWQKEIFRTSLMHNHQLNISGGTEQNRFAITGGYLDQQGIAQGSGFERYSLRMNFDSKINKWLTVGINAYTAKTKNTNTIDNGGIISLAIRQLPEVPAKNPDGSWGTQQENMYGTYFANPLEEALTRENYAKGAQISVNAYADISPIKDLVLRIEGNGNYNYSNAYQFTPAYDYGNFKQQSAGARFASNGSFTNLKTYLTYTKTFAEKHNLSIMAGHEAQENKWESLSGSRSNYFLNTVHELDAGDSKTAKNGSSRSSGGIESYFGRFNYGFDDRYLLTATFRRDGSDKFGTNNRWGTFPSLAAAWKIKNEPFLKNNPAIDNLKLRLGWGLVGNQAASSYAYGVSMASAASIWGTGFYPANFANPDLKWEKTNAYNIGLDLSLFKNRIELTTEVYLKKIDNLLMQAVLPDYISGLIAAPWVNAGSMTNKGVELTLNTININKNGLFWKSGLTFSMNRNRVTHLYTDATAIQGKIGAETFTLTKVGNPVGQFYGYNVIGMFQNESDFYLKDNQHHAVLDQEGNKVPIALPKDKSIGVNGIWVGDFIFEDKNKDGKIDEQDRDFIGNPDPKFILGLNNYFSYKGFDLNIFLNAVYGNKIYNQLRKDFTNPMNNSGMLKKTTEIALIETIDPSGSDQDISNVRVSNPNASIQRITVSDANDNSRMSNRFIEDGSYLRLKNISLGYTFSQNLLKRYQIENLRLYVNIQNLFTWTKYTGYDPEIGSYNQNVLLRGIDYARYPAQRIYTLGLNFMF